MKTFDVKIPDYYILQKTDGSGKEQIVKYYSKDESNESEPKYYGYYGINSYHEVVSLKKNIRELTEKERTLVSEKKYWKLPQQFYHSFPEY